MSRTILLVDDHAAFRRSARALLADEGLDVVAEAANGTEALRLAAELRPEVVLLDVQLPDLDGFVVADRLVRKDGPTVILISTRDPREYGGQVEASAAHGFISKSRLSGVTIREIAG